MKRTVLCGFTLAWALVVHARPVEITIRSTAPHAGASDEGTLSASAVVVQDRSEPARKIAISVPGRATIELPEGVWRLQVNAAGWFHPGNVITVAKRETGNVTIPIWPLGTLHGKVRTSDNTALSDFAARWTPSGERSGALTEGELPCTIQENEFRCPVPAGTLNLKMGGKGYGSKFIWGLTVPPRGVVELPVIQLRRGAGAYGWVTVGPGVSFDHVKTSVRLIPTSMSGSGLRRPIVTTVDQRGFFSFGGVDPGAYRVIASATNGESEARELVIRQGRESELLRPLILERRVPLLVTISPANDPSGVPWQLVVTRAPNAYGESAVVDQASSDAAGVITVPDLAPGAYEISVSPKGKDTSYVSRAIEMPRDSAIVLEIRTTRLVGTVTMNGRPLAAAVIWIGGKYRKPAVTLTSGPEGAFEGIVPFDPDDTWIATVTQTTPAISTTIKQRPVVEDENTARLDLVIPAGMLDGVVLENDGSPAARGLANVIRTEDEKADVTQARIIDGRFEVAGLDPGDYTVYAEGPGGRVSAKSIVSVTKDGVSSINLVLGNSLRLGGRLTTEDGTPIAGAKVFVNSVEAPAPVWIPRTTSGTGEFATDLPEGTRSVDVVVIAPGFAFKTFRAPLETDKQLVVLLRQNGGRLELTIPAAALDGASGRIPYVLHNGVAVPAMFLLSNRVATSRSVDSALVLTAPHVEAGAYGLCHATPAEAQSLSQTMRCRFANLSPFGAAQLAISETE
jgi:hypothetical protein